MYLDFVWQKYLEICVGIFIVKLVWNYCLEVGAVLCLEVSVGAIPKSTHVFGQTPCT